MNIETFDDATKWRRIHRKKLEAGNKRERRAARTLKKCRRRHRCGTEACRVCLREFRINWAGEAVKIIIQRPNWTRCSIIPASLLVPPGQLSTFDLPAQIKRFRKRIARSALKGRTVLGGLDVSLNLENNVTVGWQFHFYMLVEGENDAALQQQVKSAFPPELTAHAPYDFSSIKDPVEVGTYAYKALFQRRSGFVGKDGNHLTRFQPLKNTELRELLQFLAQYKIGARLILSGVRRNGQRLVFTGTKPSIASRSAPRAADGAAKAK